MSHLSDHVAVISLGLEQFGEAMRGRKPRGRGLILGRQMRLRAGRDRREMLCAHLMGVATR